MTMQTIEGGNGIALRLASGSSVKLVNTSGMQTVDTWVLRDSDISEYLSVEHTRRMTAQLSPTAVARARKRLDAMLADEGFRREHANTRARQRASIARARSAEVQRSAPWKRSWVAVLRDDQRDENDSTHSGRLRLVEDQHRVAVKLVVARLHHDAIDDLEIAVALDPPVDVLAQLFALFRLRR